MEKTDETRPGCLGAVGGEPPVFSCETLQITLHYADGGEELADLLRGYFLRQSRG